MFAFWIWFDWLLFIRVQLTTTQHWLIMVWRRPGDKPLSEPNQWWPKIVTDIGVTRPIWVMEEYRASCMLNHERWNLKGQNCCGGHKCIYTFRVNTSPNPNPNPIQKRKYAHWKSKVVILPSLSPLVAPQIVITTTYGASFHNKVVITTTLGIRCQYLIYTDDDRVRAREWQAREIKISPFVPFSCCLYWQRQTSNINFKNSSPTEL